MGNKQKLVYLGSVYDSWFLHRRKLKLSDEKFAELLLTTWLASLSLQEITSSNEILSRNPSSEDCLLGSHLTTKSNTSKQDRCFVSANKARGIKPEKGLNINETCTASSLVNKENYDSDIYVYANVEELPKYEVSITLEKLHINKTENIPEPIQLPTDQIIIPDPINPVQVKIQPEEEEECIFEASYESVVEESFLNERPSIVSTDNINWELFKGLKTEVDDESISDIQHSTENHSLPSSTFLIEDPCPSNNPSTTNQEENKRQEGDLNFETADSRPSETIIAFYSKNESIAIKEENECSLKCKYCAKTFSRKDSLTDHITIHYKTKPFKCELCFKTFRLQKFLQSHQKIHTDKKSYLCGLCGKSLQSKSGLYNHQRMHTNYRIYKCDQCKQTFKTKGSLLEHATIHTGIKPYQCSICSKRYRQKSSLIIHLRRHTNEKPYMCTECDSFFTTKKQLSNHLLTHRQNKVFKCGTCHKAFANKYNLSNHLKIHSGLKPYKCELCDKTFLEQRSLTSHVMIHTGEKPYSCDYCQKRFLRKTRLNAHTRIHLANKNK